MEISDKVPQTLVKNSFIYYDVRETCLMVRNLKDQKTVRRLELYQLYAKRKDDTVSELSTPPDGQSSPQEPNRANKIDAKQVKFIGNYGRWVIITSRLDDVKPKMDTFGDG